MKGFIKGILWTALILIIAGLVILIAGSVAGGKYDVIRMVKNGELSYTLSDWSFGFGGDALFSIDDQNVFDQDVPVLSGNVEKYKIAEGSVTSLHITVGGGELILCDSEDGSYYLEAKNAEKLQATEKQGTLAVKAMRTGSSIEIGDSKAMTLYLYVPKEVDYDSVELNLGAGRMELSSIQTRKLMVDADAGQVVLSDISCEELAGDVGAGEVLVKNAKVKKNAEFSVGAGHIEAWLDVQEELRAECSVGQIALKLEGKEEDFNYEISCAAGEIKVDKSSYAGLSQERSIQNDAPKNMNLECSMGAINVTFTE